VPDHLREPAPVQGPAPSLREKGLPTPTARRLAAGPCGEAGAGVLLQEPARSAPSAARPASSRATGTRNGEQDT
jgi:hypothetical protein